METLINWLNETALNEYIMSEEWLWPSLEIVHFFGLCLLLGSSIIFDLRMIGVARSIPLKRIEIFMTLALVGFTINLMTGTLFVIGDPDRYLPNIAFRLKMLLIVIAGFNVAYYILRLRPQVMRGLEGDQLAGGGRYIAALSLTLWTSIIVLGRIIPYVEY